MELLQIEPKPVNWKKERVSLWREIHKEIRGEYPKIGYSAMMGMMTNVWNKYHSFVDEDTGAIEFDIPPIEDWEQQARWYLMNKWAGENRGFSFEWFIVKYGEWKRETVVETPVAQFDTCKYCGQRMERRKMSGHYYQCSKNPNLRHSI